MSCQRLSTRQCWNLTCVSRRNETDPSREGLWPVETNNETTFPKKMQVCQPLPQKLYCSLPLSMPRKKGMSLSLISQTHLFRCKWKLRRIAMAIIKICGVLLHILIQIAPNIYKSYITDDKKGTQQLLVQCQNALYGTMVASLLYYHKFTKSLMSIGFKINPYNPCITNKTVDSTQMTIAMLSRWWLQIKSLQ